MSSCWLEVWPFHSACFLTSQGMCVALLALWLWDLGSHILLSGVFTAAAPWNGCKRCRVGWHDLLLSGLFLYSISIKKDCKTYNSNASRSPQSCQTQMLWLLVNVGFVSCFTTVFILFIFFYFLWKKMYLKLFHLTALFCTQIYYVCRYTVPMLATGAMQ